MRPFRFSFVASLLLAAPFAMAPAACDAGTNPNPIFDGGNHVDASDAASKSDASDASDGASLDAPSSSDAPSDSSSDATPE